MMSTQALTQFLAQSDTSGSKSAYDWGKLAAEKFLDLVAWFDGDTSRFLSVGRVAILLVVIILIIRFISKLVIFAVAFLVLIGLFTTFWFQKPKDVGVFTHLADYPCELLETMKFPDWAIYCNWGGKSASTGTNPVSTTTTVATTVPPPKDDPVSTTTVITTVPPPKDDQDTRTDPAPAPPTTTIKSSLPEP